MREGSLPSPLPRTTSLALTDVLEKVNGHIESHYSVNSQTWSEPKFISDPFLRIHGLAPALNYGQQSYEGIKAFRTSNDDQIAIFRPSRNAERLVHSASYVSIPSVPVEHFLKCVHAATALNAEFVPPHHTGAALYIRPLLFGSAAQLGLSPPTEYTFCVYVLPVGVYHGARSVDALILEDFDRAAPRGTGSAKIGGNYAPVLRWSEKAKAEGFGITLHLDSQTRTVIDEFSTSGFIGVKESHGRYTLVVPDSKNVIQSVTSDSVCEIAQSLGWGVDRRPVAYEELPSFSEVMAAGTAVALVPIKSITMRSKNDKFVYREGSDKPGPACEKLLSTLKGIQQGIIKDSFGWLDYVIEEKDIAPQAVTNGAIAPNSSIDQMP